VSYRVFARKYRPQTFEEVVGQEHITRTLQNAIRQNRLAQAYLMVGPRGIGKTSTARILAKALNCEKGTSPNPCGVCSTCLSIAEGNNLDVLEIDGASNNSVDNIRELREGVAYSPNSGKFKVYLIDEVHMLSTGAFNALLKTLEEPPPHVKFIFATTEAQKVPATITSRCQRFDLRRIPADLMAAHLAHIARQEKIELEPEAADAIARGADGGLRDAESMLDQVVAFCGEKITAEDVFEVFGFTSSEVIAAIGRAILQGDNAASLDTLRQQAESGKDLPRLLIEVVSWFRDLLVGAGTNAAFGLELPPQDKLLAVLDVFSEAEGRMRWAADKRIHFELALIKAAHALQQASLDEVIAALAALGGGETPPTRPAPARSPAVKAPVPSPAPVADTPHPKTVETSERPPAPAPQPPVEEVKAAAPAASSDAATIWQEVTAAASLKGLVKFGWLETGNFVSEKDGVFLVEFPGSQRSALESIFWEDAEKTLLAMLAERAGRPCKVEYRFVLAEPPSDQFYEPSPAEEEIPAPTEKAAKADEVADEAKRMEEYRDDPKIRAALELFEAEIISIKTP